MVFFFSYVGKKVKILGHSETYSLTYIFSMRKELRKTKVLRIHEMFNSELQEREPSNDLSPINCPKGYKSMV